MKRVLMLIGIASLLIVVGVCFNGCGGGGSSSAIAPTPTPKLPSNLTPVQQALIDALPPDPGEAGKATLEGIDSDHDGVRDDIQRYIVLNYLDSAKTRTALTQYAKAVQTTLPEANDKQASLENEKEVSGAMDCLMYIVGSALKAAPVLNMLHKELVNTQERKSAYDRYDGQLSGGVFYAPPVDQRASFCKFNPNQLED